MKLACVQHDLVFGDADANVRAIVGHLESLATQGVDLAIFPECAVTGYCVSGEEEARRIALPEGSAALAPIQDACDRLGIEAIVGYADVCGGALRNVAGLFSPGEARREYVKSHLPELGFDRYAEPGRELPVFQTRKAKVGILICFDLRIPEASRVLALAGAEIIALPTNWPEGARLAPKHIVITRAAENRVFYAACNRVGTENGFPFFGWSTIVAPNGTVLAQAGEDAETIVVELDPAEARQKQSVIQAGVFETNTFSTRQPDLYAALSKAP